MINVVKDSVEKGGTKEGSQGPGRMQEVMAQTSVGRWRRGQLTTEDGAQPLVGVERLWPKTELG